MVSEGTRLLAGIFTFGVWVVPTVTSTSALFRLGPSLRGRVHDLYCEK